MLAAVGGAYPWATLPCVVVAAVLLLVSGARVAADPATRSIDLAVVAALAVIAAQMVPLPPAILALSPATRHLQDAYALEPLAGWRPISIHPAATRTALALALAGAFVFWAAREAFARGRTSAAIRLLAWVGFGCALVSLAQRATAPRTVYWVWRLADPRAMPFGPFIDRNHLAVWLVLVISVVTGYLTMRVRAYMSERSGHGWRATIVALSDGDSLGILGCVAAMLITLAATLSRSGFAALAASAAIGMMLASRDRRRGLWAGTAAVVVLLAMAAWLNAEGLVQRVQGTIDASPIGRLAIWRETLHIIRDFPIAGTGAGTFADAMFVYQRIGNEVLFNHAHNEYLQLLTEGGVILLIAALAGCVLLTRAARRQLAVDHGPHRYIRIGACAGLAASAVASLWEVPLRTPANLLLAAILAALAVRPARGTAPAEEPPPA